MSNELDDVNGLEKIPNSTFEGQLPVNFRRMAVSFLRSQGYTFRTIFNKMMEEFGPERLPDSYDERSVGKDFQAATKAIEGETAGYVKQYRLDQLARVEELIESVFPQALEGDKAAFDRSLRALNYQAKLVGLFKDYDDVDDSEGVEESDMLTVEEASTKVLNLLEVAQKRMLKDKVTLEETEEDPIIIEGHQVVPRENSEASE